MSGIFRTLNVFLVESCCDHFICALAKSTKMPFYAVARGRNTGIYHSWADCEAQVKGFSRAKFKKFDSMSGAKEFINSNSYNNGSYPNRSTYNNGQSSSSNNRKRSYSTSATNNHDNIISSWDDEAGFGSSRSYLDVVLNRQIEDLEKRLNSSSKGIDRLPKTESKSSHAEPKKTRFIEPPQPKRYRHNENTDFEEDKEGYVQVYTDGACSANGKHGARAGLGVYWGENHRFNRSLPVSGRATNNCGEIQAATLAVKTAIQNGVNKLAINTDSQFLINAATKWMSGWKKRGWKLASGEAVKNEIDFKELDSVQNKIQIKWNYVRAHNGQYGNEMADKLAKAGAAKYNK